MRLGLAPCEERLKYVTECNRNGVQIHKFHSNRVLTLNLFVIHLLHENNNNLVSHKHDCWRKENGIDYLYLSEVTVHVVRSNIIQHLYSKFIGFILLRHFVCHQSEDVIYYSIAPNSLVSYPYSHNTRYHREIHRWIDTYIY